MLTRLLDTVRMARGAADRPGGEICNDLDRLVPAFRERVVELVARMEADGHAPLVWETWRSPERIAFLVQRGTGSPGSMHAYGLAVDLVHRERLWKAPRAFWRSLRDHAEALGITSGARFRRRVDLPHVQAIPVAMQAKIRTLGPHLTAAFVERLLHRPDDSDLAERPTTPSRRPLS